MQQGFLLPGRAGPVSRPAEAGGCPAEPFGGGSNAAAIWGNALSNAPVHSPHFSPRTIRRASPSGAPRRDWRTPTPAGSHSVRRASPVPVRWLRQADTGDSDAGRTHLGGAHLPGGFGVSARLATPTPAGSHPSGAHLPGGFGAPQRLATPTPAGSHPGGAHLTGASARLRRVLATPPPTPAGSHLGPARISPAASALRRDWRLRRRAGSIWAARISPAASAHPPETGDSDAGRIDIWAAHISPVASALRQRLATPTPADRIWAARISPAASALRRDWDPDAGGFASGRRAFPAASALRRDWRPRHRPDRSGRRRISPAASALRRRLATPSRPDRIWAGAHLPAASALRQRLATPTPAGSHLGGAHLPRRLRRSAETGDPDAGRISSGRRASPRRLRRSAGWARPRLGLSRPSLDDSVAFNSAQRGQTAIGDLEAARGHACDLLSMVRRLGSAPGLGHGRCCCSPPSRPESGDPARPPASSARGRPAPEDRHPSGRDDLSERAGARGTRRDLRSAAARRATGAGSRGPTRRLKSRLHVAERRLQKT